MIALHQYLNLTTKPLLLGALMLLAGCQDSSPSNQSPDSHSSTARTIDQLNFGVVSTESSSGLKAGFELFFEDMSASLGIPVRVFFTPDYAGIIKAMRFGIIHLSWMGNKSAIEAVDRADAEVFAHTTLADGTAGYHSVIIVRAQNPYQNIDEVIADAANLNFGNGDPNSTSGYLVPSHYLWSRRDLDPAKLFKRVINANYEANLMSIAAGQLDVATNNTMDLAKFTHKRPDLASGIRVVWTSPLIPPDPLLWRKDLPDDIKSRLRDFVLSYVQPGPDQQRQLKVLAGMAQEWGVFKPSTNAQLNPTRQIILAKQIMTIQNSERLSDEQKSQQLAPLKAQLAELQAAENSTP